MRQVFIPMSDEVQQGRAEFLRRGKAAVTEALALDDAEEEFDLVDPRRMRGRVDEHEAVSMACVEVRPAIECPIVVDVQVVRTM